MNELATHFVRLLAQTTVAMAVAVVAVGLILRGLRVTSPAAHRVGWTLALLAGWWFVRLSIQAPWYDPLEPAPPEALAALPAASTELPIEPASTTDAATLLRQADALLAMGQPAGALVANQNGLIEIGPGGDVVSGSPAEDSPLDGLIVGSAPLPADLDLPIGARPLAPKPLEVESVEPAATVSASVWPLVVVVAWALGAAISVIGWLVGYARFVRRLPRPRPASESWTEQWRALQAAHNIRRTIPLRVTENLGPMLCRLPRGYALLVPEALWRDLDAPQRAAVLRHELAHFLRRDVWKSLAVRCLALPHWFNPLSWWAVRQFDEAAEWACDRAAAANEPVTSYARTLVRLGESAARHAAYSPSARAASLSARVRRLLAGSSDSDSIVKKLLLSSIALAAVLTLAVRVELVARERDESTAEGVAQAAPDADGIVELATTDVEGAERDSAAADGNSAPKPDDKPAAEMEPDALAEADADLIEAAERGFTTASAAYNTDTITLDEVCAWSLRWLAAVDVTAKNADEKVAGARANLERFRALRTQIKALHDVGARGGEAEKLAMTDYYVADAKRRVIHAVREAEQATKRLSKARDAAIRQDNQVRDAKANVTAARQAQLRVSQAKAELAEALDEYKVSKDSNDPEKRDAATQRLAAAHDAISSAEYDEAVALRKGQYIATLTQEPLAKTASGDTPDILYADGRAQPVDDLQAAEEKVKSARRHAGETVIALREAKRQGDDAAIAAAEKNVAASAQQLSEAEREAIQVRDRASAVEKQQQDSRSRLESIHQAENRVKAAKTNLEELVRARDAARQLGIPATHEAARLQAVEAERELEASLRELMEVRKKTQPATAAAPSIEEQLRVLLAREENLKQAKAHQRDAWAAQVAADRSGDQDRGAAAEKRVAEAVRQVEAAELAIVVSRGVHFSKTELASEERSRNRVNEAEAQLAEAEKKQAAAVQQKERAAAAADEGVLVAATEHLAQANQFLAVNRRAARQANETFQNLLTSRLKREGAAPAQAEGVLDNDAIFGSASPPSGKLTQQLKAAQDNLQRVVRLREQYQVELDKATADMQGAEDRDSYMPEIQDKIQSDPKIRKLEEDISEYDLAIAKYKKLRKSDDGKVNHTLETYRKEMAGLQEKLEERTAELQEKFFEPARAQRVREARTRIDAAKATIERLDGQIAECKQQIAELTSALEKLGPASQERHTDDHKSKLRYNGRSFADWKNELETELSPARMREACGAFAAFARNGYGAEATGPIVEVAGDYLSPSMNLSSPQGQLIEEALRVLADLPIEYVLPAINESLANPQLGRRLFAVYVLSLRTDKSPAAIPPLLVGAQDADSSVSELAVGALAQLDLKSDEVLAAIRQALASSDDKIVIAAIQVVGGVRPGEGRMPTPTLAEFAPELIKHLKSDHQKVSLVALRALANCGVDAAPALPIVLPWLKEKDSPRQTPVLRLLYALGPRAAEATPLLVELADSGGAGEKEAIRCLGAIGPAAKDAVPRLMAIANSRSNTGAAAVRALGRMGPAAKEAIPLLEKFATKPDWPHLREDAQAALPFVRGEKRLSELPDGDGLTGTKAVVAPAKAAPTVAPAPPTVAE